MMNLFTNIFTGKARVETKANRHHAAPAHSGPVNAGVGKRPILKRVGPGQAVGTPMRYDRLADEGYRRNVMAYRSINLVASSVASIPLKLSDGTEAFETHPLLGLLARPNPRHKGTSFVKHLISQYLIAGNAYTLAVGPDGGTPKELWLLRPDTMQVIEGHDGLPMGYKQSVGGKSRTFVPDSVMHMRTFNPLSDWYGMAPLEAAAMAIDSHNEGSRWNLALIQNGGAPSGVLYQSDSDMVLSDKQFKHLKDQIEEQYTGAVNAGRPLLLEGGLKWQDMGLSPKDMDWTTAKNMTAREIAQAFGVPPQMLGVPDAQTYANYAEARLSLWEDTVIPLAKELVSELNTWLPPAFDTGLKLTLDLDDIPALAIKRQAQFERINASDFLTVNEKRRVLGFEELEDEQGDRLLKPMAMI